MKEQVSVQSQRNALRNVLIKISHEMSSKIPNLTELFKNPQNV